jgi:DNA modification methylase
MWRPKLGAAATCNANGYVPNVREHAICAAYERSEHPTQKPYSLIAELVLRRSNQRDFDPRPFHGSGTTLVGAKNLNRRAIGIEICEAYAEIGAKRLMQGVFQF